ncbi:hypothetical protein PsorP6_003347 [Peronosclerospora sorghi]|uniref:Uncharacterized protein n=1 Tax=Peronosclerospora sorghi TaxID=230839 RepID=A0ACC0VPL5_9STRA|nr:hypothetical protein PsorP6_003347 [Peronosclerospora sorghi]
MKRLRDECMTEAFDVSMTPPPPSLRTVISPWTSPPMLVKRCRDRSVPVDARSRMMSAAITNARIKKHSGITQLFAGECETPLVYCTVCENAGKTAKRQLQCCSMERCHHCEEIMGACSSRRCDACYNIFCSVCSTLNCDEQFDRIFCLTCNHYQLRG